MDRSDMEQHVARTRVLALIQQKVDYIEAQSDTPKLITNIYGMVGVGKTQLMHQLFARCKDRYAVTLLNFDAEEQLRHPEYSRSWQEIAGLLRHITPLKQLPEEIRLPDNQALPGAEPRVIGMQSHEQVSPETAIARPFLLLLDAVDELPYWKWIQELLIKPLLDQQHTLIVVTSQSPLFWHFWELREQSELVELNAFTLDETRTFLRTQGMEELTEALYAITGGYALGLEYLVRLLRKEQVVDPGELNEQLLATYRHGLLEKLISQLPPKIRGEHLEDVLQHIVAMGADFDLAFLRRQINEKRSRSQAEVLPPGRVNNTITLLNSRGFVLYDREQRKYRLDPLIKHLILTPMDSTSVPTTC